MPESFRVKKPKPASLAGWRLLIVRRLICNRHFFCSQHAFTMVELVIAVAIMGILASIAAPLSAGYIYRVQVCRAVTDIRVIEKAIACHYLEDDDYPDTLNEVGYGTFLDPWGVPYRYMKIAGDKQVIGKARKNRFLVPINGDYDLYSIGKDGLTVTPLTAKKSYDDVVRANDGEFVGLAYLL